MVPAARVCASAFSPMASVMSEKVLPVGIMFFNPYVLQLQVSARGGSELFT